MGMSAADRDAQFRIPRTVDPADRRGIALPVERFEAAQPPHGFAPWQTGNRWRWMQHAGQGKRGLSRGRGGDGGMQMHQLPMTGQLGASRASWLQPAIDQVVGDRLSDQFMLPTIFV